MTKHVVKFLLQLYYVDGAICNCCRIIDCITFGHFSPVLVLWSKAVLNSAKKKKINIDEFSSLDLTHSEIAYTNNNNENQKKLAQNP